MIATSARSPGLFFVVGALFSLLVALQPAHAIVLVDDNTAGYYNSSLGTTLDGSQPQFPLSFASGGDPTIYPASEPDLAPVASVLGDWLLHPETRNAFWGALGPVPTDWGTDTETAIIYEVDGGTNGLTNVLAQLDVDNGIFVWVNGKYKFGAVAGGSPSAPGQFEYTNVVLGVLAPGTNYLQILREDNGFFTGYQILVTGDPNPVSPPMIVQHPTNQTATLGQTVTLGVVASSPGGMAYQWWFYGNAIPNATNSSLVLTNVQFHQAGWYFVTVANAFGTVTSSNALLAVVSSNVTFVDGNTPGYYNDSLGTILDGTQPQFPLPFPDGGDPTIDPAAEPDLTAAASVLGNWLAPASGLNSYWSALTLIPATWANNTETAIIYELDGGATGFASLVGDFDVDNGLFVWLNGQYKFGAVAAGSPSESGQFEYTNVVLGALSPGTNYLQILRQDNGIFNGYQIRVTGQAIVPPPTPPWFGPSQWVPGVGFLMTLNLETGRSYRVQYVADLGDTNWITLTNFISPGNQVQFVDATITSQRWFRAISP